MNENRNTPRGKEAIRREVRRHYAEIAKGVRRIGTEGACGCATSTECDDGTGCSSAYSPADLASDAAEANLGLGCGNPLLFASLRAGEVVLDLGSGAGFDAFLAAKCVGKHGGVIGVDMTPEMVERARKLAESRGMSNVQFRLGEIEQLPVRSVSIDVIISNCVINLSPDKDRVFREAFRVLKAGGRIAIADIVALKTLPEAVRSDLESYVECVSGAIEEPVLRRMLEETGFREVRFDYASGPDGPERRPAGRPRPPVASAIIWAVKPLDL